MFAWELKQMEQISGFLAALSGDLAATKTSAIAKVGFPNKRSLKSPVGVCCLLSPKTKKRSVRPHLPCALGYILWGGVLRDKNAHHFLD